MTRRRSKSVGEIARFVTLGYSQSPENCRVLLDEIERLRTELCLSRIDTDLANGRMVSIPADLILRLRAATEGVVIDRDNDSIKGDVDL